MKKKYNNNININQSILEVYLYTIIAIIITVQRHPNLRIVGRNGIQ